MAKGETWKKWERDNTTTINIRFHNAHDADILDALEQARKKGEPKVSAMKRWARIGIDSDKKK